MSYAQVVPLVDQFVGRRLVSFGWWFMFLTLCCYHPSGLDALALVVTIVIVIYLKRSSIHLLYVRKVRALRQTHVSWAPKGAHFTSNRSFSAPFNSTDLVSPIHFPQPPRITSPFHLPMAPMLVRLCSQMATKEAVRKCPCRRALTPAHKLKVAQGCTQADWMQQVAARRR